MSLKFIETGLPGCKVIEFDRREDERGWFQRAFSQKELSELNFFDNVLQANFAYTSKAGTMRGMHFQKSPFGEDKLVNCVRGSIFDVAVDLRFDSETFGHWYGVELSSERSAALLIPKGFAHGYITLQDDTMVSYFVSENYSADHEVVLSPLNKNLGITWPHSIHSMSAKDSSADINAELPESGYSFEK